MVEGSRPGGVVGQAFVSNPAAISRQLVAIVARKACQVTVTFRDKSTGEEGPAWGSGGLLRGQKVAATPETVPVVPTRMVSPPRKKVKFEEFSSYEVTPVTAKHNLEATDEEDYVRTTVQFPETSPMETIMPDGGCELTDYIEVRPAAEGVHALHTEDDDYSFGEKISTPNKTVTKTPFLFQQAPNTFKLQVDHKIGMAIFRTYDVHHDDAEAPPSTNLLSIFGPKRQACIYTGTVTEISANGKTFAHDINTFEGCSGAVVFLLDQDQPDGMDTALHGMAVGIHSGGLDNSNNMAFLLPKK